jgi:hypothetical protein
MFTRWYVVVCSYGRSTASARSRPDIPMALFRHAASGVMSIEARGRRDRRSTVKFFRRSLDVAIPSDRQSIRSGEFARTGYSADFRAAGSAGGEGQGNARGSAPGMTLLVVGAQSRSFFFRIRVGRVSTRGCKSLRRRVLQPQSH